MVSKSKKCIVAHCPNSPFRKHQTCAAHTDGSHTVSTNQINAIVNAMQKHYRVHPLSGGDFENQAVSPQSSLSGLIPLFPRR